MEPLSPTELRNNIYKLLDQVLDSGVPVEVRRRNRTLKIIPVDPVDKLGKFTEKRDIINGKPEGIVHMNWEKEIRLDLP